ncbi:histone-lysine N-methyltransferase SETD2 isoform X2 [Frankliniella occidentalis]|uniref:[histone H3]-lysine(36) N-trimethyltransferase n=1 Tax=Frankliniella occidentalis TaxID=133901 RepID=A0A9C6U238_FRAOC|nr:histone-lysine N-methyltransferase SETD2 isoform X2 [Frankliniella occidentalis]
MARTYATFVKVNFFLVGYARISPLYLKHSRKCFCTEDTARSMARKKKGSSKLNSVPEVEEGERESPTKGLQSNGLPEESQNGAVDSDDEDGVKSGYSYQLAKEAAMSPSTTVVHKKFGKISCLPPDAEHSDPNGDSEGSSQDLMDTNMVEEEEDGSDSAELLEVVLAQEQGEVSGGSVEDDEGMEDNDTETIVVEVEEGMVDEIDHQNTVIVQVVGDDLMYSEEDGATIWEVETVEEIEHDGLLQESDEAVQEEVTLSERDENTLEDCTENSEESAGNSVTSSGILEKTDGHESDVSSSLVSRHPSALDSDMSDREADDEQLAMKSKLSPDEINQMVLGSSCGIVNVAVEELTCEKDSDDPDKIHLLQRRESVITRRSSDDGDREMEVNSRLKGSPIHVYGNSKKNKSSLKIPETSVIKSNCELTTPPRRNVICLDDSPLKSPPSKERPGSSKRDDVCTNELPISSIGGSLFNVNLNSLSVKQHNLNKSPFKDGPAAFGIDPIVRKPKSNEEDLEMKKSNSIRNRSGSSDTTGSDSGSRSPTVRRSTRIRAPAAIHKKQTVSKASLESLDSPKENPSSSTSLSSVRTPTNTTSPSDVSMPVKVKSRWRRSSELEMGNIGSSESDVGTTVPSPSQPPEPPPLPAPTSHSVVLSEKELQIKKEKEEQEISDHLKDFQILTENLYLTERIKSKDAKRMACDCSLSKDEIGRGEMGCGEDCLNRLLMIECGSRCPVKNMCSNKRFQSAEYAKCEIFKTEKKGLGLRTTEDLSGGTFIMEYVGEVLDPKEFRKRAKEYSKDQNKHYYFMALKSDAIIDATMKGNHSRFINHSCEPNAETQKWTVNGELRIGFFTTKPISAGEEITFDYQFQRYGKDAQRCYCESSVCRGWIGGDPDSEKSQNQWQEWKGKDSSTKKKRDKDKDKDKRREDIDLEEEIEKLCSSGLKSRAHTLTLCRLMVRAEDIHSRAKLLKLLRDGEPACCRLFLDYHGLRLIWSWMIDNRTTDNVEAKTEILRTLKKLPIPNKTMLIDSKVWGVVERWSQLKSSTEPSPSNSERTFEEESSNDLSDKLESEDRKPKSPNTEEKAVLQPDTLSNKLDSKNPSASMDIDGDVKGDSTDSDTKACAELASLIMQNWYSLKEVFRIPKKERIEQMKEHEREADQHYKELDERYREGDRSSYDRYDRHRDERRKRSRESPDNDRGRRPRLEERSKYDDRRHDERSRYDRSRYEDRKFEDRKHEDRKYEDRRHEERHRVLEEVPRAEERHLDVKLSKEARRRAFALKVQQEEEQREARRLQAEKAVEAQRQAQEDWWRYHEERCRQLNLNPHVTAAIFNSQYYDPVTNQLLAYTTPQDPNLPQHTYPTDASHASLLFAANPGNAIPTQIQGTPFSGMFQGATPQPSPYESSHIPPGVSPVPNGVSPVVIPGLTHGSNPTAADSSLVTQAGTLEPQPSTYPAPVSEESYAQDTVPQTFQLSGAPTEIQQPAVQYLPPPVPVKLPPKWKSAKDAEGRTYYYHVKTRVSQWEPPQVPVSVLESVESESSSSSSEDENEDDNENEEEESDSTDVEEKQEEDEEEEEDDADMPLTVEQGLGMAAHHQQLMLADPDYPNFSPRPTGAEVRKKRRVGLVQEHIISPRREEERTDPKIYKQIKEKIRRQKEKKKQRERDGKSSKKRHRDSEKSKTVYSLEKPVTVAADTSSDAARKIKDQFRLNMAGVIVTHLNPYRKPDCRMGRITNTEDFKHLARKLTHFVMLKELKHCKAVDDLECNDNVKHKARDFIKKYMAKFGDVYIRPKDDD